MEEITAADRTYICIDMSCAMVLVVYFLGIVFIFKIVAFGNRWE